MSVGLLSLLSLTGVHTQYIHEDSNLQSNHEVSRQKTMDKIHSLSLFVSGLSISLVAWGFGLEKNSIDSSNKCELVL